MELELGLSLAIWRNIMSVGPIKRMMDIRVRSSNATRYKCNSNHGGCAKNFEHPLVSKFPLDMTITLYDWQGEGPA